MYALTMTATAPGVVPSHVPETCHATQKGLIVVLLVFLVVSLGKETTVLKSVSPDRFTLATAVSVPKLMETHNEGRNDTSGTFNNIDVVYRGPNRTLHSTAECIGESFSPNSWMYRSCLYRNLCFDMESNEFVLFQSPTNKLMEQSKDSSAHFLSSSLNTSVSLGGFVSNWGNGASRLEWSPKVLDPEKLVSRGCYELVGDTVMIPFHAIAPMNIGHFVWDSLLPIYTLLSMFGLAENKLVLLRYVLEGKPLLYSCEENHRFAQGCERNFQKLLPLVGVTRSEFSSTLDPALSLTHKRKSNYVCFSHGAAGIGYLTDHGRASHGKLASDYKGMHNYGRGPVLFGFRNFILRNMGMDLPDRGSPLASPIRITFSLHSSGRDHRNLDFASQISVLRGLADHNIVVESYQFSELTMEEEIEIIARSSILITVCGGGAVSSMFLPRGASLVMFYAEQKERVANAKLDFDYMNNMGYVRAHWLSTKNMNAAPSLDAFVKLIQNELEVISLQ